MPLRLCQGFSRFKINKHERNIVKPSIRLHSIRSVVVSLTLSLGLTAVVGEAQAQTIPIAVESAGAHAMSGYAYGYNRISIGTNVVAFGTGGAGLRRGWAVATLDPSEPDPAAVVHLFDPWGNEFEAQSMADFLDSLPPRTLVLIGVCDEAGLNLWDACDLKQSVAAQSLVAALERLGSRKVQELCYRDSFALVGVKGDGFALSEGVGKFTSVVLKLDVLFGDPKPVIVTQPTGQVAMVGSTVRLAASALSSTPLIVQWRKNGTPMMNETNVTLSLPTVSGAGAGLYSAEFRNSAGTVVTSNAEVAVISYPRPGSIDESFQLSSGFPGPCEIHQAIQDSNGDWVVALTMGYWPYSVPNYSGYSGGYGPGTALIITRLTADGQEDPTFARFTASGMAYALATDSQRRIYVATGNKRELSGLTRLLPNGSKDTNFVVSIDWTGSSPEYGAWINALGIDSQGRVVIGGHFSSVNGQSRWGLARLLSDGRLDDSFNPGFSSGTVATLNLLDQDSILVVSGCPPQMGRDDDAIELPSGDPAHIFIVEANGALDLTLDGDLGFTSPSYWGHGKVKATYVLPDGFALIGKSLKVVGDGNRYDVVFLNSTGRATRRFLFPGCYASAVQRDGRVLLAGVGSNSVARLNEDGMFDTVFNLPGSPNGLVSLLAVGRDDDVLLAGMFSEVGDTSRRGLARVFGTTRRMAVAPRIEDWAVDDTGFRANVQTERFYEYSLLASDTPAGPWVKRSAVVGDGSKKTVSDPNMMESQFFRIRAR